MIDGKSMTVNEWTGRVDISPKNQSLRKNMNVVENDCSSGLHMISVASKNLADKCFSQTETR